MFQVPPITVLRYLIINRISILYARSIFCLIFFIEEITEAFSQSADHAYIYTENVWQLIKKKEKRISKKREIRIDFNSLGKGEITDSSGIFQANKEPERSDL